MTRVYLPATMASLAQLHRDGRLPAPSGHAVTSALGESYAAGGTEELEYAAMLDAADASLRLLAVDPDAPPRRVVVAADTGAGSVVPERGDDSPGGSAGSRVRLAAGIGLEQVVSVHLDDELAAPDVAAAVAALPAAQAGDEDAAFTVSGARGHDLLWYDVTELATLLGC